VTSTLHWGLFKRDKTGHASGVYQCTRCGYPADPTSGCPNCGEPPPPLAVEIERLNREIAEMSARDLSIQRERANLSATMQAALHQRSLLVGAQSERMRRMPKQRTVPFRRKAQPSGPPPPPLPVAEDIPQAEPEAGLRPEASSRSVQNILLTLGGLLIGLAAAVFIAVATTFLDDTARAAILVLATVLVLFVPPFLLRGELTSTAETLTTVGLVMVPLAGYAFWNIDPIRNIFDPPGTTFTGLILAGTAAVAAAYRTMTGLTAPRYVAVGALQPVVPLLAYPWIVSPAGWALVLAAVAALDLALEFGLSRSTLPTARWLREVVWVLHGAAIGAALVYSVVALADAKTLSSAALAAATLVGSATIGLVGALTLRQRPLPDVAAGVMTLALIGSASRVATVALPGRALVLIAGAVAVAGLVVRALPDTARRGPQYAASGALGVVGVVVAGAALRAAAAPIRAVLPVWHADLGAYAARLADAVQPAGWQIVAAAALLTVAAALAVPEHLAREATVAGVAVTALAAPASLGLAWGTTPWVLLLAAVGIGAAGLGAPTDQAARVHVGAALVVGLAAAATSLARPDLTAGVLTGLAFAGGVIGTAPRWWPPADAAKRITADAALGGAAAALPGAAATSVVAWVPAASAVAILGASFLAVAGSLSAAAMITVGQRRTSAPLAAGGTAGALAVTIASFGAEGATVFDALVALSLLVGALLLWFAPAMDAGRTSRRFDGSDVAAAAVTAGTIGALTRVTSLLVPDIGLAMPAALVLAVALGVRLVPEQSRRGPVLGCAVAGGFVGVLAAYAAAFGALRVLLATSPTWHADLDAWPSTVAAGRLFGGQPPLALVLLAFAAMAVLPKASRVVVVPIALGLAVAGAPAAFGLLWWTPVPLGLLGAGAFGVAAVATAVPRAGITRAAVAAVLAGFAVGAGLVDEWATAGALLGVTAIAILVATFARLASAIRLNDPPESVSHLVPVGGVAVAGALLALPGAIASLAAATGRPADIALPAAFAATSIGLAVIAAARRFTGDYLTYATIGIAAAATTIALVAWPLGQPLGGYAAAAALLGVLAELHRSGTVPPREPGGVLTPGLLAAAGVPTILAIVSIGPPLFAALTMPHQTLRHIWQGPEAAGIDWTGRSFGDGSSVLTALVLTLAFALVAVAGGARAYVLPVVLPGLAITLLIAPYGLHLPWPAGTLAALGVYTISMLGVALSPPPPATIASRALRATRGIVFGIGLAAGGAGLAGSLATRSTTLFTLGGSAVVGATAALRGTTRTARILGWAAASISAYFFAYVSGLAIGLPSHWSAFGVLAVAATVLVVAATLPRLATAEARGEASVLEWSGYAGALLALALAARSTPHLAALLAAWGAVLGVAAVRQGRSVGQRRTLLWAAAGFEVAAWWLLASTAEIALPEAYTLPFAGLALIVGVIELRLHPELGSWAAYGPALVAAFVPTLAIVLVTDSDPTRRVVLLLAAAGTLIAGSMRRQQAPVWVGGVVTTIAAVHELFLASVWLVLIPVGVLLLILGASNEKRRRKVRATLTRLR